MSIQNFLTERDLVTWTYFKKKISMEVSKINQGIVVDDSLVLILTGGKVYPETLIGYDEKGKKLFQSTAPKYFTFCYLTPHPNIGMSIVCGAEKSIEGSYDWHFSIDKKTGFLKRCFPAR